MIPGERSEFYGVLGFSCACTISYAAAINLELYQAVLVSLAVFVLALFLDAVLIVVGGGLR